MQPFTLGSGLFGSGTIRQTAEKHSLEEAAPTRPFLVAGPVVEVHMYTAFLVSVISCVYSACALSHDPRRPTLPLRLILPPESAFLRWTINPIVINPLQDVKPMFISGAVIVMLTAVAVHLKLKSIYSKLIRSYQARQVTWCGDLHYEVV